MYNLYEPRLYVWGKLHNTYNKLWHSLSFTSLRNVAAGL